MWRILFIGGPVDGLFEDHPKPPPAEVSFVYAGKIVRAIYKRDYTNASGSDCLRFVYEGDRKVNP